MLPYNSRHINRMQGTNVLPLLCWAGESGHTRVPLTAASTEAEPRMFRLCYVLEPGQCKNNSPPVVSKWGFEGGELLDPRLFLARLPPNCDWHE